MKNSMPFIELILSVTGFILAQGTGSEASAEIWYSAVSLPTADHP